MMIDKSASVIQQKRQEYKVIVSRYMNDGVRKDEDAFHQISIDVPRTSPSETLFREPRLREALLRVLYCCSIRRPASGYVQGMNDLATPLFDVFLRKYEEKTNDLGNDVQSFIKVDSEVWMNIEADVYWCLAKLLDRVQDNFTFNQAGLYKQIALLKEIVQRADGTHL